MIHEITRRYDFISGHYLPNVPEGHRCKRQHGHNYAVEISVRGPLTDDTAWVLDFWDLDTIVQPLLDMIDHRNLNDVQGLENPTAEVIAAWFMERIDNELAQHDLPAHTISKVRVFETEDCIATVLNGEEV